MSAPRVFLSYSHDSQEHIERVLALCDQMRRDGIDADIDQYEPSPPQGWPQWMLDQIEGAEFVCVVCTEIYNRRARGKELAGIGLGARWEGAIITQETYEARRSEKYIPLVFRSEDSEHIP